MQPVAVADESAQATPPGAVLVTVAADAAPTHFDVFLEQPNANMESWPGKNSLRTVLVGRIPLAGGAGTCCVIARQVPIDAGSLTMPRPGPEQVERMRDALARSTLYGTLITPRADGTLALFDGRLESDDAEARTAAATTS